MCLNGIDSTGIKPAKEGWKVFKKVCLDGTLFPLYCGGNINPGKWISTMSFLEKLFVENKTMIYIHGARVGQEGKQMTFKKTKYETIEFEDENEFVIGSVLLYEGKVCNAEICEDVIGDKASIKKVEDFLKEVKKMEWIRNEKTY